MAHLGDILQPALPVKPVFCESVDTSLPPATAEEYLQRVVLEAAECDDVMVADVDGAQFANKRTPVFRSPPLCAAAPPQVAPSSEWQRRQVSAFSRVRRALSLARARNQTPLPPAFTHLPEAGDEKGWHRFCFGILPRAGERGAEAAASDQGTPPFVSLILHMNQPMVEQVLEHHVGWLESAAVCASRGRWLYALLAALQLPLTPDMCFVLRSLARHCAAQRASHPQDKVDPETVASLNLLICIVALYFRQTDLADP